jgi:23S rRNA (uracil1939-C5)-methyltransferase
MKKGDRLTVDITDLDSSASGIANYNSYTIIVAGGVPGDILLIDIVHISRHKKSAWAEIVKIITNSKNRKKHFCRLSILSHGSCGGCALGHLSTELQHTFKINLIKTALEAYSLKCDVSFTESGQTTGYRNRTNFIPFRHKNKIVPGSFAPKTNRPANMTGCKIVTPEISKAMSLIAMVLSNSDRSVTGKKTLRHITVRSAGDQTVLTDLVWGASLKEIPDPLKNIAKEISNIPIVSGVSVTSNTGSGNAIRTSESTNLHGTFFTRQKTGPLQLSLAASSFFQLNTSVAEMMYAAAASRAKDNTVIWDLYCGVGGLGLTAAASVKNSTVYGADHINLSVRQAQKHADRHSITAHFETINLSESFSVSWPAPKLILANPPRRWIDRPVKKLLADRKNCSLVYMSCNPVSFAKDAHELCNSGYTLEYVAGYDMLPNTPHVELLGFFNKTDAAAT